MKIFLVGEPRLAPIRLATSFNKSCWVQWQSRLSSELYFIEFNVFIIYVCNVILKLNGRN